MHAKIADLEDRSRQNNLKLRGVPESVPAQELKQYAKDLFHTLVPELTPLDLTIDCIHRIPKPSFLSTEVPRDVLMRVHFFPAKEQILRKSRSLGKLPDPYTNIQIYADLSKYNLDLHRQLNMVTKTLCNNNITYKWKHPTKLIVERNGASFTTASLEKGLSLLGEWGIIPTQAPQAGAHILPDKLPPYWFNSQSGPRTRNR